MTNTNRPADSVIVVRHGIVCGRGPTLHAAVADMLGRLDISPAQASELSAGDSATRTRYSTGIVAAAITSVLADAAAKSGAILARQTREIAAEREQQRREDRGIYRE